MSKLTILTNYNRSHTITVCIDCHKIPEYCDCKNCSCSDELLNQKIKTLNLQSEIEDVIFWLKRACVGIKLEDYESALDKLNRASFEMDWVKIAMIYGDNQ